MPLVRSPINSWLTKGYLSPNWERPVGLPRGRPAVANFRAEACGARATVGQHFHTASTIGDIYINCTWCCNLQPNYVMWWRFRKRQRTASTWRTTSCAQQFWEFPAGLNPSSLCSFTFQSGLANHSLVDYSWLAYFMPDVDWWFQPVPATSDSSGSLEWHVRVYTVMMRLDHLKVDVWVTEKYRGKMRVCVTILTKPNRHKFEERNDAGSHWVIKLGAPRKAARIKQNNLQINPKHLRLQLTMTIVLDQCQLYNIYILSLYIYMCVYTL